MLDRLTGNIDFQGKALALRSERQKVLASNIANADTPGYQARDIDFAAALRQATSPAAGSGGTGSTALLYRQPDQPTLDGNTVDLDRERANFADNSVRYEATLRFISQNVKTALSAIRGD